MPTWNSVLSPDEMAWPGLSLILVTMAERTKSGRCEDQSWSTVVAATTTCFKFSGVCFSAVDRSWMRRFLTDERDFDDFVEYFLLEQVVLRDLQRWQHDDQDAGKAEEWLKKKKIKRLVSTRNARKEQKKKASFTRARSPQPNKTMTVTKAGVKWFKLMPHCFQTSPCQSRRCLKYLRIFGKHESWCDGLSP